MLEHFFHWPPQIARLRKNPGVELLNAFAEHLKQSGYSRSQGCRHLRATAHLLHWLEHRGSALNETSPVVIGEFVRHLPRCRCPGFTGMQHDRLLRGIRAFTAFRDGRMLCTERHDDAVVSTLWEHFSRWMREQRGLSERTLSDYRHRLRHLLADLDDEPSKLNVAYLRRFTLELGRNGGNAVVKSTTTALRQFVRFLIVAGQCPVGLEEAIPDIAEGTTTRSEVCRRVAPVA